MTCRFRKCPTSTWLLVSESSFVLGSMNCDRLHVKSFSPRPYRVLPWMRKQKQTSGNPNMTCACQSIWQFQNNTVRFPATFNVTISFLLQTWLIFFSPKWQLWSWSFSKVTGSASNSWSAENTALTILNFGQRTQFIQTKNIMIQTLRFLIGYLNLPIAFTMYLHHRLPHQMLWKLFCVQKYVPNTGLIHCHPRLQKGVGKLNMPMCILRTELQQRDHEKMKRSPAHGSEDLFSKPWILCYLPWPHSVILAPISVDFWHVFEAMIPWSQTRISSQIVLQSPSNAEKKQIWGLSPGYQNMLKQKIRSTSRFFKDGNASAPMICNWKRPLHIDHTHQIKTNHVYIYIYKYIYK